MKRGVGWLLLVVTGVVLGLMVRVDDPVRASDAIATVARATLNMPQRIGDRYWIESHAVATTLAPVPQTKTASGATLLAARRTPRKAKLFALNETKPEAFCASVLKSGSIESTNPSDEFTGYQVIAGDTLAVVRVFGKSVRLALVAFGAKDQQRLVALDIDTLFQQLWRRADMIPKSSAPLFAGGAWSGVLRDFKRFGGRWFRDRGDVHVVCEAFRFESAKYATLNDFQGAIEEALINASWKRSAGNRPRVGTQEAFVGEYFMSDRPWIARVLYVDLGPEWLAMVFESHQQHRAKLATIADDFANSLKPTGIVDESANTLPFSRVHDIRLVVWRDQDNLRWGVLFDDTGGQQVMWREEGVEWSLLVLRHGDVVENRLGNANTSYELNPAWKAGQRSIPLKSDLETTLEIRVSVGERRTSAMFDWQKD